MKQELRAIVKTKEQPGDQNVPLVVDLDGTSPVSFPGLASNVAIVIAIGIAIWVARVLVLG